MKDKCKFKYKDLYLLLIKKKRKNTMKDVFFNLKASLFQVSFKKTSKINSENEYYLLHQSFLYPIIDV